MMRNALRDYAIFNAGSRVIRLRYGMETHNLGDETDSIWINNNIPTSTRFPSGIPVLVSQLTPNNSSTWLEQVNEVWRYFRVLRVGVTCIPRFTRSTHDAVCTYTGLATDVVMGPPPAWSLYPEAIYTAGVTPQQIRNQVTTDGYTWLNKMRQYPNSRYHAGGTMIHHGAKARQVRNGNPTPAETTTTVYYDEHDDGLDRWLSVDYATSSPGALQWGAPIVAWAPISTDSPADLPDTIPSYTYDVYYTMDIEVKSRRKTTNRIMPLVPGS